MKLSDAGLQTHNVLVTRLNLIYGLPCNLGVGNDLKQKHGECTFIWKHSFYLLKGKKQQEDDPSLLQMTDFYINKIKM